MLLTFVWEAASPLWLPLFGFLFALLNSLSLIMLPNNPTRPFIYPAMPLLRWITVVIALGATGCEQAGVTQKLKSLDDRVTELEKALESHGAINGILYKSTADDVKQITERLDLLSTRVLEESFLQKFAMLDPSSKGYSVLDTGRGSLLISCDNAAPYLEGHRIKLRLGNPLNMQFSGFKLKFKFGRKPPALPGTGKTKPQNSGKTIEQWQKDYQMWKTTLKSAEESFTDDLKPGSWTTVEATLPQTKPEDIAYLEIAIDTDRISLSK
jgi:hypothetical protein